MMDHDTETTASHQNSDCRCHRIGNIGSVLEQYYCGIFVRAIQIPEKFWVKF